MTVVPVQVNQDENVTLGAEAAFRLLTAKATYQQI
jgi:hypothetical protein